MKSEARRKSPISLDASLSLEALRSGLQVFCVVCLLRRSGIRGGMLKRCDEVGAAGGGLQPGTTRILGCLDRLQSAFWSC